MKRFTSPCPALRATLLATCLLGAGALAQDGDDHYEEATQAYAAKEYAEAYVHLKNALQADPNMVAARLLLARVHFNAGDIHGAAKESEEALLLGADINLVLPVYGTALLLQRRIDDLFAIEKVADEFSEETRFEWALLKGQGYLIKREPDRARREFERAAEMFPSDVRSINTLAAVYLQSGMLEETAGLIEKSLLLDPDNVKSLELEADLAITEGHYAKAQASLDKAFAQNSEDIRVLRSLARVHLLAGNQAEMEHYLELILEISPDDPAATLLSAVVAIGRGDADIGDEMLAGLSLKLAELDSVMPQSSDRMLFIRAASDYVRHSDQSAMALFNSYLSRNESDLAAIRMLVDLYLRNGEERRANELLSSSREYVLRDLGLSLQLLHLYIQNGSALSARELLEDLREQTGDNPIVAVLEAELERSLGHPDRALAVLDASADDGAMPVSHGLLRGAVLLELGRQEEAEDAAARMQEMHPGVVRVHNFAAVTYLRSGRFEDAEQAIDRALAISRSDPEARFNRAMLYKMNGELEAAASLANEVLQDKPDHTRSIMLMASVLFEQGRVDEAVDWSKKVYAYDKTSTLPDEFMLGVYTQTGNLDKAVVSAVQLTRADPMNAGYQVSLAELYMRQGDFEVAQKPLRRLASIWADDPDKLRELAAMQASTENLQEARLSLEAARKLEPDSLAIGLDLARLELAENDIDAAEKRVAAMAEAVGEQSGLSQLEGEIALARGDAEGAQAHFMRAYELDRTNGDAIVRLYELSLRGIGGEAFTNTLEAAMREQPLPPQVVRLLADSYLAQGKPDSARRYYETLLSHPQLGEDPAVLNNLANIYAEEDLDLALTTAQRALELQGETNSALLDTLGWIHARRGEYEEALPYLRRAYTLNSRDPEIRYHTGVTLHGLDRLPEAEKELRAALEPGVEFNGRADAQRLLDSLAR